MVEALLAAILPTEYLGGGVMDWTIFGVALGVAIITGSFTISGFLLVHILNIREAKFVQETQSQQKRRDASVAVTEILAAWVHSTYKGNSSNETRWQLQTTYWKNILLLEKDLLELLMPVLANEPDSVGTNELIVQTRKVILGLPEADIRAEQLNNWPPIKNENLK
jgi:hypothetical protein